MEELRLRNNPGVIKTKLSENLLSKLRRDIEKCSNFSNKFNHQLVGQIEEEYKIDLDVEVQNFILKTTKDYQEFFKFKRDKSPVIIECWVNKQKKYEYNPIHNHRYDIAYVVWVDIPYNVKDEHAHSNSNNTHMKRNSAFEFIYTTLTGKIETHQFFPTNGESEGTMIMFPSQLKHAVYPFYTSDGYRVSTSGNIDLV
jgi:hypothetical protein